jgi:hypothetical protein
MAQGLGYGIAKQTCLWGQSVIPFEQTDRLVWQVAQKMLSNFPHAVMQVQVCQTSDCHLSNSSK